MKVGAAAPGPALGSSCLRDTAIGSSDVVAA